VGDSRGANHPAPANCFALRLDDELALRLTERHHTADVYRLVERDRAHLERWIPWTASATPASVEALVADELSRFAAATAGAPSCATAANPSG